MMKFIGTFLALLALACSEKAIQYDQLEIAQIHVDQYSVASEGKETISFAHSIILKHFDVVQYSSNDLILLADSYIDTVTNMKPIRSITIAKPFIFERTHDSEDWGNIRDNAIISFKFNTDSAYTGLPEITSITLWENGNPIHLGHYTKDRLNNLSVHKRTERTSE